MELSDLADGYLFWFYLLGQCSLKPHAKTDRKLRCSRIIENLPAILFTLLPIFLMVYVIWYEIYYHFFSERMVALVVLHILFAAFTFRGIAPPIQSMYCRQHVLNIWTELHAVENVFEEQLQIKIGFEGFSRDFLMRATVILMGFSFTAVVRLVFQSLTFSLDDSIERALITFLGVGMFPVWHSIFYICLIKTIFSKLSRQTESVANGVDIHNVHFVISLLKSYKIIHYRLCIVKHLVNQTLGWCWIPIYLHNFVDFIFCCYRVCVIVVNRDFSFEMLREFDEHSRSLLQ